MMPRWDFPIEQLTKQRDERFQLRFARAAAALLAPSEEVELHASADGLAVRGRNEDALEFPLSILRERYGDHLQAGPPRVRFWEDGTRNAHPHEPIMQVRIASARAFLDAIERELSMRGVDVQERHLARANGVLRGEAPLARLLGLPARLRAVTNGSAQHWVVLSHYAPVTPDPDGGRAA